MGGQAGHSYSKGDESGSFGQSVWGTQGGALGGLYDQAGQLWGGQQDAVQQGASNANDVYNSANAAWQQQLGGGFRNPALEQSLATSMNMPTSTQGIYAQMMGGDPNSMFVDPAIQMAQNDIMQNFNENIMPSIAGNAVDAGQLGSSRHGVAEGIAARGASDQMAQTAANMRLNNWNTDLQNKLNIAQMADSNKLQAQQNAMNYLGMQNQQAFGGLGQTGMMQGAGQGQAMAPWGVLGQYANLLGNPTVLGSGTQSGSNMGKGYMGGGGMYG